MLKEYSTLNWKLEIKVYGNIYSKSVHMHMHEIICKSLQNLIVVFLIVWVKWSDQVSAPNIDLFSQFKLLLFLMTDIWSCQNVNNTINR